MSKNKTVYAFIDAANLFYGGFDSLRWNVDYQKLLKYIKTKFGVSKAFYYAGVETDQYLPKNKGAEINLDNLLKYFQNKLRNKNIKKTDILLIDKHIQRVKFYRKLSEFGYNLRLKPVKIFINDGQTIKKANCDVDLTFDLMRYLSQYTEVVALSGDGDFAPVLHYLIRKKKKINILSRSNRTAKEIRQIAGDKFMDFAYLREQLSFK